MLPFKDRVLFLSPLIFLYSIELLFQSLPTLVSLIILSLIASFSFFILKRFLVFLFYFMNVFVFLVSSVSLPHHAYF